MYSLLCECGKTTVIRASHAGLTVTCSGCGSQLDVPSIRKLKSFNDQGQPAPVTRVVQSDLEDSIPGAAHAFVTLCSGRIGNLGFCSHSAITNYVNLVMPLFEDATLDIPDATGCELMLSCALMPDDHLFVTIETSPDAVSPARLAQLKASVEAVRRPTVVDGPVSFIAYRRINLPSQEQPSLQPFGPIHAKIESEGIDSALMQAVGLTWVDPEKQQKEKRAKPSLWTRISAAWKRITRRHKKEELQLSEEDYWWMHAWLSEREQFFSQEPTNKIKNQSIYAPYDVGHIMGLAARHVTLGEFTQAIDCYTRALSHRPNFAPAYERRAAVYRAAESREGAMADLNRAIEIAPFNAAMFFRRALLLAELEAWDQALDDFNTACRMSPREPGYFFSRAQFFLDRNRVEEAAKDLTRTLSLDPNCGHAHGLLGYLYCLESRQDLDLALEHFDRAIELVPGDVRPRIHRCLIYSGQNKYEMALEECDQILRAEPENGYGYWLRGRTLLVKGDYDETLESCERAIELGFEAACVYVTRGHAYASTDQLELAMAECDAALAIDGADPSALQLRGMLCMHLGDVESATEMFERAREVAPEWSQPRMQLSLLHRIKENPQAAVEEETQLIDRDPQNASHYANRALAYTELLDFPKATEDFDRACELSPLSPDIRFMRACFLLDRGQKESALRDLDAILELDTDYDDARLRRASVLFSLDRHDEALKDYEILIARHPDNPLAYTGRAYVNQLLGKEDDVENDLARLDQLAPEMAEQHQIQSLCAKVKRLEEQGRPEEAITVADEVIRLSPETSIGYHLRGYVHWYDEQWVEAYDDYTQALQLEPDCPSLLNSRGHIQAEMGEFRAALDDLDSAVDQSRESGNSLLLAYSLNGRALALGGLGRLEESLVNYNESVELCPDNAWVHYNRALLLYQREDFEPAGKLFRRALECQSPALTIRKRKRAESLLRAIESGPST